MYSLRAGGLRLVICVFIAFLADEVHHDEVENDVRKDEVGERAFRAYVRKFGFILRIHLKIRLRFTNKDVTLLT